MSEQTYNGWANYETWAVYSWLTNDEPLYRELGARTARAWREADAAGRPEYFTRSQAARYALAAELKDWCEEDSGLARVPEGLESSLLSDLLGRALGRVEWDELADNLLEGADDASEDAYEPLAAQRVRERAAR
jgi:hypothetical protein